MKHKLKTAGKTKSFITLAPVAVAYGTSKAYDWASNNPGQATSIAFAAGAWWNDFQKKSKE